MEYVSAQWHLDPVTGAQRGIDATDENGVVWLVPGAECDVPPWPSYLEKNGLKSIKAPPQVDPAKEADQ